MWGSGPPFASGGSNTALTDAHPHRSDRWPSLGARMCLKSKLVHREGSNPLRSRFGDRIRQDHGCSPAYMTSRSANIDAERNTFGGSSAARECYRHVRWMERESRMPAGREYLEHGKVSQCPDGQQRHKRVPHYRTDCDDEDSKIAALEPVYEIVGIRALKPKLEFLGDVARHEEASCCGEAGAPLLAHLPTGFCAS